MWAKSDHERGCDQPRDRSNCAAQRVITGGNTQYRWRGASFFVRVARAPPRLGRFEPISERSEV